jgi:hypothetical protein
MATAFFVRTGNGQTIFYNLEEGIKSITTYMSAEGFLTPEQWKAALETDMANDGLTMKNSAVLDKFLPFVRGREEYLAFEEAPIAPQGPVQ